MPSDLKKWAACISYLGTGFSGWQRQANATSVQECLEDALGFVASHPVIVTAAGRTDAGVHATGQIIHFESNAARSANNWLMGANTRLPPTIRVNDVCKVPCYFDARFSANSRTYRYLIYNAPQISPIWHQHAATVKEEINIDAMNKAAQLLIGEHDFSAFRAAGCQSRHAIRELISLQVLRKDHFISIEIKANAFLYHMVRILVAALLLVGKGKKSPEWLFEQLQSKKRTQEVIMMPSHGLYLVDVGYPEENSHTLVTSHQPEGYIPS